MPTESGEVVLRPLHADHRRAAEEFAARIPQGERAFIDRSLLNQVSVAGWTRPTRARRAGAFVGDDMIAILTVDPQPGWMSHVGELRLVVLPEQRGKGIARMLVNHALDVAADIGLRKVYVEVLASLTRVRDMFIALGFEQEAVLHHHVIVGDGSVGDLVIVSRFIDSAAER